MKQQTMKHIPLSEFLETLEAFVKQSGGRAAASEKLGLSRTAVQMVINGERSPGNKVLRHFGLTTDRVIVPVKHQPTGSIGGE